MKRFLMCICASLVVLVGCTEPPVPDIPKTDSEAEGLEEQLLTNVYTPEYYKTLVPYVSSETRGLVYSYLPNRYDMDEFESALMRHSQDYYKIDDVYFQEGMYLSRDFIKGLLWDDADMTEIKTSNPDYKSYSLNTNDGKMVEINGVNVSPSYLAYVLEQNYIKIENDSQKLEGITVGLALNPYQKYTDEAGYEQLTKMDEEALIKEGKKLAQELLVLLRQQEGLENVDIMLGLYILEEQSAVIPGNMVAKTLVEADSNEIKDWTEITEQYYLLPSDEVQTLDYQTAEQFKTFKEVITDYYPHYYGIIGIAQTINNQIVSIDITINVQFYSLSEKLSFHQLISSLIEENFMNHYDINVTVRSSDEIYGILHRGANESEITLKLTNWE